MEVPYLDSSQNCLYPLHYGAYVNVFLVFSPDVTHEKSGMLIWPWGRLWHALPAIIARRLRHSEELAMETDSGNGLKSRSCNTMALQTRPT
ncbi:hypothetical protein EDB82DRAFT_494285 [Fusarium venenatum]|uniref:uncharacterized protein n=1 Tax=Fusarium venenatum TaxID=56646 RepID=UPI001D9C8296|nr:hypothetical protein EDB82DRAFT_494285 [Fusarium venenatum]